MRFLLTLLFLSILLTLSIGEIKLLTQWLGEWEHYKNSWSFFLCSGIIGVLAVVGSYYVKTSPSSGKINRYVALVFIVLGSWWLYPYFTQILQEFPDIHHNATHSDIIPQVHTLVSRFINGEFPYHTIREWGYDLNPTYLTLTWLPFVIPFQLSLDFRIFAILIFLFALWYFNVKKSDNWLSTLLSIGFFFYLLWQLMLHESNVIGVTIETMIAGFYLLFMTTWQSKSWLFIGAGLVLCLLSRYSLVIWVPLFLYYLGSFFSKKVMIRSFLVVIAGVILLYLLPFMTKDHRIFQKGLKHHKIAALGAWKDHPEHPYTLYRGLGLTYLFYERNNKTLENRLTYLQTCQISALICLCLGLGFLFHFTKHSIINCNLHMLGSFKLYLTLFYHLIQIPYPYLFLVLIAVDIPILVSFGNQLVLESVPKNQKRYTALTNQ